MQLSAVLFVTSIALSRHPKEALLTSVMMALVATQYYFLILTSFSTYPFEPRRHHMWVMCTQSLMIDDDDFSLQQLAFLVDHHDNEVPVPSRFFSELDSKSRYCGRTACCRTKAANERRWTKGS